MWGWVIWLRISSSLQKTRFKPSVYFLCACVCACAQTCHSMQTTVCMWGQIAPCRSCCSVVPSGPGHGTAFAISVSPSCWICFLKIYLLKMVLYARQRIVLFCFLELSCSYNKLIHIVYLLLGVLLDRTSRQFLVIDSGIQDWSLRISQNLPHSHLSLTKKLCRSRYWFIRLFVYLILTSGAHSSRRYGKLWSGYPGIAAGNSGLAWDS